MKKKAIIFLFLCLKYRFLISTKQKKDHQKRLKIEKVIREKLRGDKTFETDFNYIYLTLTVFVGDCRATFL